MNSLFVAIVTFQLALCLAVNGAAATANSGSIHGVVRAKGGDVVSGATVVVSATGSIDKRATTDERGNFFIDALPTGDYTVAAYLGPLVVTKSRVDVSRVALSRRVNLTFGANEPNYGESATGVFLIDPGPWDEEADRGTFALGADTDFVSGGPIDFGNLVVLRPRGQIISSRAIYTFAADLLAKRPESGDDKTLQSGHIGVDVALGPRGVAYVELEGGRQQRDLGRWSTAAVGGSWKREFLPFFAGDVRLGAQTTSLFNRADGDQWLAEGVAGGELLFTFPCIKSKGWLGASLALPLAHSGGPSRAIEPASQEGGELDPRVRIGVDIGFALGALEDWDMFLKLAVRDRGDRQVAGTTLPILIGGSDQTHVIFGMARRFGGAN